ncbi:MAG: hypothetical protein A3F41_03230 [Coxiella sp. RIFCSPHIGHO2_12_FULL_44_14]|nr:MAG: hypothetical protein A3F41_03230 [Coxiella sp. RIFCSPHIGHO2_12_FULL_44_14]
MEHYENILKFWFGHVEETVVPSENRARIWFGESPEVDTEIKEKFNPDLENAVRGRYVEWEKKPHGQLGLIIILDQFSRHIYRHAPQAFAQDDYALSICTQGMEKRNDHALSLIERVFYYFPLLHSEHLGYQEQSIRAYQMLVELALPETQIIYESFFKFANHHYSIVRRFGRFPQRNVILGRESTEDEKKYLQESERL